MKKLSMILLAATIAGGVARAQDAVTMQTCEYWFDYDFEHRQSVTMNAGGQYQQQFDVSAMAKGVHSIGVRFGDSRGLWCSPFVKHFVIPTLPPATHDGNQIVKMEYWFDYDFDHRQTLASTNGTAALALDVSAMAKGVHSLGYRTADSRGIYTAPFVKHFVVPNFETEPTITGITAYEYWFNHGPRVRVEVAEQTPLDLQNLVVEVKDVVPNAITSDYRFDAAEGIVYVPDQVTFGIQAFDNVGHPSSGIVSESFAYTVPVSLQPNSLKNNATEEVAAPSLGNIQSFTAEAEVGDSVVFDLNGAGRFDLYDEAGNPVEIITVQDKETGRVSYKALAPTRLLYALLWDMPAATETVEVSYTAFSPTGVKNVEADGIHIRSEKGSLSVRTPRAGLVGIYAVNGTEVAHRQIGQGTHTFTLSAGVYIIRFDHRTIAKTIVR